MDNAMEGGAKCRARDEIVGRDFVETKGRTKKEAKKKAALYIKNKLIRPQNYEKEADSEAIPSTGSIPHHPPQKYPMDNCGDYDDTTFVTIQLRIRCPKELLKAASGHGNRTQGYMVDIKDIVLRNTGNSTLHPCHIVEESPTIINKDEQEEEGEGMIRVGKLSPLKQQQQQQHRTEAEEYRKDANEGQLRPSSPKQGHKHYSQISTLKACPASSIRKNTGNLPQQQPQGQRQQQHKLHAKQHQGHLQRPRPPIPITSSSSSSPSPFSSSHKQQLKQQPHYFNAYYEGSTGYLPASAPLLQQHMQQDQQQQQQQQQQQRRRRRLYQSSPPLTFRKRERVMALYAGSWHPAQIVNVVYAQASVVVLYDGYPNEPTLLPYGSVRRQ
eukprot:CAMPEP_0185281446 /NCGR_PEP_ID=MMETSP1359-20130426/66724_1 /TAXON_ID=552665 /ORGANISM="Bigelowiella longifila, Strain CCMP242" /LENGTH=383 /DNA_ID=CAMNT_0027876881 /DNA_START=552 /DNA_END=1703 /DNA_ORIENTATION=-